MALLTQTKTKKLAITSLLNKPAIHDTHDVSDSAPSLESSELEEEEEEEEEVEERGHHLRREDTLLNEYRPTCGSPITSCPYSLTSGPLIRSSKRRISLSTASVSCSRRSRYHHVDFTSGSSSPLPYDVSPPASSLMSEEQIHPSDYLKTLLLQLGSSISASKQAFTLFRASSSPRACAKNTRNRAEKAMEEELQTLPNLHMSLYSLIQQHEFGKEQDSSCETSNSESMGPNYHLGNVERQDAMLKAYEGIINRFHDEIRRKDAVAEALKQTLAKSMLKSEKLEQRMKILEAKLSPQHIK